jgi:16S rRNA (cytosine967-C5)-methyltransferase
LTERRGSAGVDPARAAALDALRAVRERGAYANLVLPQALTERGLSGRDAALATELAYGTARSAGVLDEIIGAASGRPLARIDGPVLDVLRLGAYQLLRTRIPAHAAVATTVSLARTTGAARASGFVNAVLRRIGQRDWTAWTADLGRNRDALGRVALRTAHPDWIARAFAAGLGPAGHEGAAAGADGGANGLDAVSEVEVALAADDERPATHLLARPGLIDRDELVRESGGVAGPYSPYAVHLTGGDPGALAAVRDGRAGVQDEGSQLCAVALATVSLADGPDERWLDMCAGPGGKAALLAALAAPRGARLTAVEQRPHRAELVRRAVARFDVDVQVADARTLTGQYDRVLLDAPCTGLGALRRRPEARWRRTEADLADLVGLQAELLAAARRLVRPGGVIGYVTCSPHPAETVDQVAGLDLLDARPHFPGVPRLGRGPAVQLWPHRQGTDAMFCALIAG